MASATILSTALIAGMVAAFNPCGFALLPAYLAYFVGTDPDKIGTNRAKNILRSLVVGLTMSSAFLLLFGLFGALTSSLLSSSAVQDRLQWATLILGIAIIPLGFLMLLGKEITIKLPRLQKGGQGNNLASIFLFGLSFAIVSLGCTAPVFFATVVGSFSSDGWFEGIQIFIAYGLGMSLIVLFLTMAVGMVRTEVAVLMKKILPHIGKISGIFLVLTGIFLTFYGWWEIQIQRGNYSTNWLVDTSTMFQNTISNWIADVGSGKLAIVLGILLMGALIWASTSTTQTTKKERRDLLRWRYSILTALTFLLLVLEIVRYDWKLIILPFYNTVIDLPSRVWGWISDPIRWSVPFEILLAAFLIAIVTFQTRKKLRIKKELKKELADKELVDA